MSCIQLRFGSSCAVSDMLLPASPAQFLKVEEEAGNPVERMANMLPRIVAADYQPLPESVRSLTG